MIQLEKRNFAYHAITTAYGIGNTLAKKLMGIVMLHPRAVFNDLKTRKNHIQQICMLLLLGFPLKLLQFKHLLQKAKNLTYSGIRGFLGMPTRGQRTKTNAKTTRRLHKSGIFYIFPIRKIIKGFIKGRRKMKKT